uniref:Uncharacterized protein n=1 Tax=Tetradesmus obliquus TaxID=3088 RepID=A0A383W025_TETOB|eukprot:jgi/Sobl393_1/18082/SZX71037.1
MPGGLLDQHCLQVCLPPSCLPIRLPARSGAVAGVGPHPGQRSAAGSSGGGSGVQFASLARSAELILDTEEDPGACEIVRFKGPFALELAPQLPRKPAEEVHDPLQAERGPSQETLYADLYQEAGGQLSAAEAAAVARWRAATGGAAVLQAAAAAEPWVTEQQLQDSGLLDNPSYVQMKLTGSSYGRYGKRLMKHITKAFFRRIYEALKILQCQQQDEEDGLDMDEGEEGLDPPEGSGGMAASY